MNRKRFLHFGIIPIVGCLLLVGCRTNQDTTAKDAFDSVNVADGVDAREAKVLAQIYFGRVYGGCGVISEAIDANSNWKFQTYVGIAGIERDPILVDKYGRKIMCAGGPTIEDMSLLLKSDKIWEKPCRIGNTSP
jgi:hypothetical protein